MKASQIVDIIDKQRESLRKTNKVPAYIILDKETFQIVRSGASRRDYLWYGYECVDVNAPDTLCGLIVAVLPGNSMSRIIEVRE